MSLDNPARIACRVRLNALVDRGWLAAMSPTGLSVWTAYNVEAGAGGIARVPLGGVASLIGHGSTGHARKARRRPCELNLLGRIEFDGPGLAARWLVLVPPERPAAEVTAAADHGKGAA